MIDNHELGSRFSSDNLVDQDLVDQEAFFWFFLNFILFFYTAGSY